MFDFTAIPWLGVVVCMITAIVSGSIWFGPKTFFPVWWKGIGKGDGQVPGGGQNMGMVFGLTFVACFVQALFMSVVLHAVYPQGYDMVQGISAGVLFWLAFVMPTYLVNKLFAAHPLYVWGIEIGNHLVNFVLFGIILSFFA
jgi:Protein of unknown function (DUF1761)